MEMFRFCFSLFIFLMFVILSYLCFFYSFFTWEKERDTHHPKKRFVWFEICLIAPFSLIAFKQTIRQFFFCFSFISANITTLTITLKQKEDSTNLSNCSWMNSFKNCWILLSFYNDPLAMFADHLNDRIFFKGQ